MERRLAAILSADVVGYTRLMGEDEMGTLQRLTALREGILEPLIADHRGRVVKLMGDGLLVEFASLVDAVGCAVKWQTAVEEHEAEQPEGDRFSFRIGVNLGDVLIEGEDIHGDGVNIAARLEGLAEPGGICLSGDAYRQAKGKVKVDFEDLGERDLKNVDEPVRVYRIVSDGAEAAPTKAPLPLPDKPSIAVLAFDNLSGDPDQEYFADGIAEDIITALSKFRWFFVIARNSSFTYKGKSVDVKQVAEELGVRYVLEGSVRKTGSRVRISAQLIDAATGNHVWAERYDRELADIFDLQDEMTATIVGAIEPELGTAERDRAKRKPPDNLDAWEQYQRGLWHFWRYTREDADEAERLFQSAIDLDPGFGPAYAGVAYLLNFHVIYGWTDTPDQTLGRALRAGQLAVSADDKDPFAHFALGRTQTLQGEFETAIAELEKAIDLNPNLALAYYGLGFALTWSGRAREALPYFQKAIRQSPHDPALWTFETMTGFAHLHLGEYVEAVEWLRKGARHPNSIFWPNVNLAVAFVGQEEWDKARAALDAELELQPDLSVTAVAAMLGSLHPDWKDRYLDALHKAGLPQ
ncbi:MAG: adenylate/guanylate cyclase domain-containing protein [Alphaproteobacteria bacterium]